MIQVRASGAKDLTKRIVSIKISNYRTYQIAKSLKYDGYQRSPACIVYKIFDKKTGSYRNEKLTPNFLIVFCNSLAITSIFFV